MLIKIILLNRINQLQKIIFAFNSKIKLFLLEIKFV